MHLGVFDYLDSNEMLSFIAKIVAKKLLKDNQWNRFGVEDPYYETVQVSNRFGKVMNVKKPRKVPQGISENDLDILMKFQKRAHRYDMLFNLWGISFGWSNIVGLIPFVGTFISTYWSVKLLLLARQLDDGLPIDLLFLFILNIVIDLVIGFIPIVGDLIVIGYKSNLRNYTLLRKHLEKVGEKNTIYITDNDSDNIIDNSSTLKGRPKRTII